MELKIAWLLCVVAEQRQWQGLSPFGREVVAKICGGNLMRVWREVEALAAAAAGEPPADL